MTPTKTAAVDANLPQRAPSAALVTALATPPRHAPETLPPAPPTLSPMTARTVAPTSDAPAVNAPLAISSARQSWASTPTPTTPHPATTPTASLPAPRPNSAPTPASACSRISSTARRAPATAHARTEYAQGPAHSARCAAGSIGTGTWLSVLGAPSAPSSSFRCSAAAGRGVGGGRRRRYRRREGSCLRMIRGGGSRSHSCTRCRHRQWVADQVIIGAAAAIGAALVIEGILAGSRGSRDRASRRCRRRVIIRGRV